MKIVDTANRSAWRKASKTVPLLARPMSELIDPTFSHLFRLNTLEGVAQIDAGAMLCLGAEGEAWQQSLTNIQKKYSLELVLTSGPYANWLRYVPKDGNIVEFFVVDEEDPHAELFVQGLWGETVDEIPNLQRCSNLDVVCRNPADTRDVWVVRRRLFNNTYSILGG